MFAYRNGPFRGEIKCTDTVVGLVMLTTKCYFPFFNKNLDEGLSATILSSSKSRSIRIRPNYVVAGSK